MANEQFIFTLGADISKFTKSITEVEAELKSVRNTLKTQTHGAIAETNKYIQQLEDSLVNLKKVGFSGVAKGAQQGQTALFALGQVARDLPFGFIAIQNNLPLLVDQFVALKQSTGGATKALGAILNSIAGPAGLAFAFGVATSAITGLVQEYGSLSNAFGQLFGFTTRTKIATDELSKAQISATASGIAEAKSIDNLINILNNSKATYQERLGAYEGLKNIIPDVISALDKEETVNGKNLATLQRLAAIKKENIILDGTRQALIKAIEKESTNAFTQLATLQKQDFFADIAPSLKGILKGYAPFLAKQLEITDQIGQSANAFQFLSDILKDVDNKIAKNTGTVQEQIDAYKKELEAIKNQEKAIKSAAAARKKADKEAAESNKRRLESFIQYLKDLQINEKRLAAEQARASFGGLDFAEAVRKQGEQAAKDQKNLDGWNWIIEKIAMKTFDAQMATDGMTQSLKGFSNILKPTTDAIKQVKWENTYNLIYDNLINPLEYLFDTVLQKGKFSWKDFGNIVIEQLKRIVVQIAATTAAAALANIIVPGAGTLGVKVANAATGSVPGGGGVGVTKTSAVNFGGMQGGLALNGQVVFVQRGSDLVGVINRANATINRVG